ncbi:Gfo/Idh/MocA family oxidoreductase [Clostridium oceanicum]|uniref:Gfo/Idh/MocA family oxidoreductase n=1 Tax=Clostridium oceanicum TaxID=1543 RepID=A0ABP3UN28_9CLOT
MIRIGIIGTNFITDQFIEGCKLVKDIKISAVYSRTLKKAEEFSKKYSIENRFTNLEDMAKSNIIDAVYIASPNSLHKKQSLLFLNNKKHVLCEKPSCSNVKELKEIIEVSKKNKVLFMEAMKSSFMPNFKTIKENLYKIGKVRRYFASYCKYSSRYDLYKEGKNPNTFNPKFSNGSLMDLGVYCIYPVINLFGIPNKIDANAFKLESGVDGQGSVSLSYDSMDAIIMHSKIANSYMLNEIEGEKGTIVIDQISTPENVKIIYKDGKKEDITRKQIKENMCYEIEEFVNLIKEGKIESTINSHELSFNVMKVLETSRKQFGLLYDADKE